MLDSHPGQSLELSEGNGVAIIFQIWQCSGNNVGGDIMWTKCVLCSRGPNYVEVSDCWPWTVNKRRGFCPEQSPSSQTMAGGWICEWMGSILDLVGLSRLTWYGSLLRCNQCIAMSNESTAWLPQKLGKVIVTCAALWKKWREAWGCLSFGWAFGTDVQGCMYVGHC